MTLEEAIQFHTEEAEKMKLHRKVNEIILGTETYERKLQEHTQTAEWLRELAERRKSDNEIPFGNAPFSELDSIINAYEIHGNHKKVVELLKELRDRRKLPVIVYCKDCKHKGTKNCVANAWTTIFGVTVKDDFFCGLGKRRTDDND